MTPRGGETPAAVPARAVVVAPATRRALAARETRATAAASGPLDRDAARKSIRRQLLSGLAALCAVVLLTGALPMLLGVLPGAGPGRTEALGWYWLPAVLLLSSAALLVMAAHTRLAERREQAGRGTGRG